MAKKKASKNQDISVSAEIHPTTSMVQPPVAVQTKHRLFITGGAGYVGAMLIDLFSRRNDVEAIIAIDKEPLPDFIADAPNLTFIVGNLYCW
jgi:hypothetical protein